MNNGLKIAFGSFLVTAALIKAAPALSEPVQPQNIVIVPTADLDLSTDTGRRQLDHRLARAAAEACGSASDSDLVGKNAERQCRRDVLAKARARGDLLTAGATDANGILVAASR